MPSNVEVFRNGLWFANPASVQLLGLCPLLAVSTSLSNAAGLGLATIVVMTLSSLATSSIRNFIKPYLRLPIFVTLIASLVTLTELLMAAYSPELRQSLGIFLPLIVTNCMILGRLEASAVRSSAWSASIDGFSQALGFTAILLVLGGVREVLAFGAIARIPIIELNWLLAALPAGGFLLFGLLLAAFRYYQQ